MATEILRKADLSPARWRKLIKHIGFLPQHEGKHLHLQNFLTLIVPDSEENVKFTGDRWCAQCVGPINTRITMPGYTVVIKKVECRTGTMYCLKRFRLFAVTYGEGSVAKLWI